MTTFPEVLETDRLRLRPPMPEDAAAIFAAYARDVDVTRYLMWRPHGSVAETEAYVERCVAGWAERTELTWMVTRRDDGALLGAIALRPHGHKASLGYVLARPHWGRGIIPEAGRAVMAAAEATPALHRVWATCDVDNRASARVMEKLGMTREGVLRRWVVHPNVSATPRDALCYAWVRDDDPAR